MVKKRGLITKVITVYNSRTDDEIDLFVTYEIVDSENLEDDETYFNSNYEIDIKSFEPNNESEELLEWVTEDLVYDYLYDEIEIDMSEDELTEEESDDEFYEDYENDYLEGDEDY